MPLTPAGTSSPGLSGALVCPRISHGFFRLSKPQPELSLSCKACTSFQSLDPQERHRHPSGRNPLFLQPHLPAASRNRHFHLSLFFGLFFLFSIFGCPAACRVPQASAEVATYTAAMAIYCSSANAGSLTHCQAGHQITSHSVPQTPMIPLPHSGTAHIALFCYC